MKKILTVALLFMVILSSCKKDKDEETFKLNMTYTTAQQAQLTIDEKIITDYISKNSIQNVQRTANGLYYVIVQPGTGDFRYTASSYITAKYTGRLLSNGSVFDSSSTGIGFALTRVIYGWQEGITLIQSGGKVRLFIPSVLGYGAQGSGPIPANAVLDFDIELISASK